MRCYALSERAATWGRPYTRVRRGFAPDRGRRAWYDEALCGSGALDRAGRCAVGVENAVRVENPRLGDGYLAADVDHAAYSADAPGRLGDGTDEVHLQFDRRRP